MKRKNPTNSTPTTSVAEAGERLKAEIDNVAASLSTIDEPAYRYLQLYLTRDHDGSLRVWSCRPHRQVSGLNNWL